MSAARTSRRTASKRRKIATSDADYGRRALRRLAWLMEHADSEQAQVAAAKELLDWAHGAAGAGMAQSAKAGMEGVVARLRELRLMRGGKAHDEE